MYTSEMALECHTRSVHGPRPKPNLKQYFNDDGDINVEDDSDNDEDWKASKEDERLLKEDEDFIPCTYCNFKSRYIKDIKNHIDFTHSVMKRINQQVRKNILPKGKGPTENKNKVHKVSGQKEFKSCPVIFVIKLLHKTLILNGTYLKCIKLERIRLLQ